MSTVHIYRDANHPQHVQDAILPALRKLELDENLASVVAGLMNGWGCDVEGATSYVKHAMKLLTPRTSPSRFGKQQLSQIAEECYRRTNPDAVFLRSSALPDVRDLKGIHSVSPNFKGGKK